MSTLKFDEYRKMQHDIAKINPNRGSSPKQTKGFYAEVINATENNLERIKKDIDARIVVVDNNGASDAIVTYVNGQTGREIQDKVGYTYSQLKQMIDSGKYDGMIFSINKDHPVFSNSKQLESLKEVAKQRNIKITSSNVSEKEVLDLAKVTAREAQVRTAIGLDGNEAPVVAIGYTAKKFVDDSMKDTKSFISEQTGRFMSEDFKQINAAGVDEAFNSAMFAAVLSTTKNTISVVKGEESKIDAIKEILYDTSSAAVLGCATGVVKETFDIGSNGDAALLVNGTIQISKQVFSYVSGEIDEQQLVEGVAETTAYLASAYIGRMIGSQLIPIPIVGPYIGEMISTAVCAEVISTIKFSKEFDKQNSKIIVLYKQAEEEIRASQVRLECLIQRENEMLSFAIKEGFEKIVSGILNDSYVQIEDGIMTIGERFQLSKEELTEGEVTQENLFLDSDDVLIIR